MAAEKPRIALVAGASGLVGGELVRALAAGGVYSRVIALTRRPLTFEASRLANRIIRFETMEADLRGLSCDTAFCCLGSTLREAGSRQAFRAVDLDLVLRFARFAQLAGAGTLVAVSATGAAANSRNFYFKVKGETELALEALRFRSLHLMQPALLLGPRAQWRTAEVLGKLVMPLLNPLLLGSYDRWRAIEARTLAAAMVAAAVSGRLGVQRYSGRALKMLARNGRSPPHL